jgi:hypothetical protein
MSNDMGPAEEILQDGWTDVERLEKEVKCQDVGGKDPSSSLSYVRQSEEPVTGPLIPAGHESDDESGVEVVVTHDRTLRWNDKGLIYIPHHVMDCRSVSHNPTGYGAEHRCTQLMVCWQCFYLRRSRATTFKESTIFRNKVRPGKIWWEEVLEG